MILNIKSPAARAARAPLKPGLDALPVKRVPAGQQGDGVLRLEHVQAHGARDRAPSPAAPETRRRPLPPRRRRRRRRRWTKQNQTDGCHTQSKSRRHSSVHRTARLHVWFRRAIVTI